MNSPKVTPEELDASAGEHLCEPSPAANQKPDETCAFEKWLSDTCPSGDVTEVQRKWEYSSALAAHLAEVQDWEDAQP